MDLIQVRVISIDEVSRRLGQQFMTIISKPKQDGLPTRVLLALEGRDCKTLSEFSNHLKGVRCSPKQIQTICSDVSAADIKGSS